MIAIGLYLLFRMLRRNSDRKVLERHNEWAKKDMQIRKLIWVGKSRVERRFSQGKIESEVGSGSHRDDRRERYVVTCSEA